VQQLTHVTQRELLCRFAACCSSAETSALELSACSCGCTAGAAMTCGSCKLRGSKRERDGCENGDRRQAGSEEAICQP
jgi:hypothetical protein